MATSHDLPQAVGSNETVTVIDLNQLSLDLYNEMIDNGEDIKTLGPDGDNTHFNATGADAIAELVARDILAQLPDSNLVDPSTLPEPAPEIALYGNGVAIADGDDSPSASDYTLLGSRSLTAASLPVTRTFVITNSGTGTLNLTGGTPAVSLTGDTDEITLESGPGTTNIAAGASTSFQLAFDAGADGIYTATVSIANNDANENPYTFAVQGERASGTLFIFR